MKEDISTPREEAQDCTQDAQYPPSVSVREKQFLKLQQVFCNAKTTSKLPQLVLIRGPAGGGKSFMTRALKDMAFQNGGFYIAGKFDVVHRSDPLIAIRDGLAVFAQEIWNQGDPAALKKLQHRLTKMTVEERKLLVSCVPRFRSILDAGHDSVPSDARSGHTDSSSILRFGSVFQAFMKALGTENSPLIVCFDDAHWVGSRVIDLLTSLLRDSCFRHCIFALAYREGAKHCPMEESLARLRKSETSWVTIQLDNLSLEETRGFLQGQLPTVLPYSKLLELTTLVFQETQGNPLLINQLLQTLMEGQDLGITEEGWHFELPTLDTPVAFKSRNFEAVTRRRIKQVLSRIHARVLKELACLGTQIELGSLRYLDEHKSVLDAIVILCESGILDVQAGKYVSFSSDSVHEQLYSMLVEESEAKQFHYHLGKQLWKNVSVMDLNRFVFAIVSQMIQCLELITKEKERGAVAKLCNEAGKEAVRLSSFAVAYQFLSGGVSLLGPRAWRDEYEFCIDLYSVATEVSYCASRVEDVHRFAKEVESNARSFRDTFRIHSMEVYALGSNGRDNEAIDYGILILNKLGVKVPKHPSRLQSFLSIRRAHQRLRNTSHRSILLLDPLKDPEKVCAMQILNSLFIYSAFVRLELLPIIADKMIGLTLDSGLCAYSSIGFVLYACFLCWIQADYCGGFLYGRLALEIQDSYPSEIIRGRVQAMFYGSIYSYKHSCIGASKPLEEAHRVLLAAGDYEFSLYAATIRGAILIDFLPLGEHIRMVRRYRDLMRIHGNYNMLAGSHTILYFLTHFCEPNDEACLQTERELANGQQVSFLSNNSNILISWIWFGQLIKDYVFGRYKEAYKCSLNCTALLKNTIPGGDVSNNLMFDCLAALGYAALPDTSGWIRMKTIVRVRKAIRGMKKWAEHCPDNVIGKMYLVKAELAAFEGRHKDAYQHYWISITGSEKGGFYFQTALCYERAARYFVRRGSLGEAAPLFRGALTWYEKWEAPVLVDHLKGEIKKLGACALDIESGREFVNECLLDESTVVVAT